MSQGSAEPLCARIEGMNREDSDGKADLTTVCFLPTRVDKEAVNGQDSCGVFQECTRLGRLDADSRAGLTTSKPPPPVLVFLVST